MATTVREKPSKYGEWWRTNDLDENWYRRIFANRSRAHEFFLDWLGGLIRQGKRINSILEVGCGRGEPYARLLREHGYVGVDISEKEIDFCRQRYGPDRFVVADVVAQPLQDQYDLVFAHAVVDHVYDINRFLKNLWAMTTMDLYVSSYRGWFPRLDTHDYNWEEAYTCYNNRVSPAEARSTLEAEGASKLEIFPVYVGNSADDIALETTIIASRR